MKKLEKFTLYVLAIAIIIAIGSSPTGKMLLRQFVEVVLFGVMMYHMVMSWFTPTEQTSPKSS